MLKGLTRDSRWAGWEVVWGRRQNKQDLEYCQLSIDKPNPWGHWVKCNWQAEHSVIQLTVVWCILLLELMSVSVVFPGRLQCDLLFTRSQSAVKQQCCDMNQKITCHQNRLMARQRGKGYWKSLVCSLATRDRCWHLIGSASDLYFHHTGQFMEDCHVV